MRPPVSALSGADALFDQMRDPQSVRMAAFTARDPDDRQAFDIHRAKLRTSPDITVRAVTRDGHLVGSIGCFVIDDATEITFWAARSTWGQGVAGQALALFLDTVPTRPLYARAASDNAGSLRVLRKAGFTIIGTEISYASARDTEIEETILRLGQPWDGPLPVPPPCLGRMPPSEVRGWCRGMTTFMLVEAAGHEPSG